MADLPDATTCYELLARMALIRRFEEEAGRQYQRARAGGFLHLAIGEEATIVGTTSVMREEDFLIGTYRTHGHAIARGTEPKRVMAELFGRVDGTSGGRGGSMHIFDAEKRFMGGYGIVGGNLPIAAGLALASQYKGEDAVTVCMFGDGASNTGNFGETMNLAALWKLPVLFMVENNLYGMGTSVERHSAQTDLSKKAEGYGISGRRVDGMDVVEVREGVEEGLRLAREEQRPTLLEAFTYRFRGHSAADPEVYREREEVDEWREKDPLESFAKRCVEAGVLGEREVQQARDAAEEEVKAAVAFAEDSPEPALDTMYENLYTQTEPGGWYAVDERSPEPHRGEREDQMPDAARELAEAGAAYAGQPAGERPNPANRGDVQEGEAEGVDAPDREVGEEPDEVDAPDREVGEEPDEVDAPDREVSEEPDEVDAPDREVSEEPGEVAGGSPVGEPEESRTQAPDSDEPQEVWADGPEADHSPGEEDEG
jgi:pyruvate dehydrogenase E1 component alpha subunit